MSIRSGANGGFSGAGRAHETEIDFGSTPVQSSSFTITDVAVKSDSKILVTQSANAATSRGSDEAELDFFRFSVRPAAGSFTLIVASAGGPVSGKYKVFYEVR